MNTFDIKVVSLTINNLLQTAYDFAEDVEIDAYNPKRLPMVCGYVIPEFKLEEERWTRKHKVDFICNLWQGVSAGCYTVNEEIYVGDFHPENVNVLVDGVNRLTAIEEYSHSMFKVQGQCFRDLPPNQKLFFRGIPFPKFITNLNNHEILKINNDIINTERN